VGIGEDASLLVGGFSKGKIKTFRPENEEKQLQYFHGWN
jgi:hypothetical protein